jgi:hypothetical protein
LFTDGFADQFGDLNEKKFKYKQLEEAQLHIRNFTLSDQKASFIKQFDDWKKDHE